MIRFVVAIIYKTNVKTTSFCGKNCVHQINTAKKMCSRVGLHNKTLLLPRTYRRRLLAYSISVLLNLMTALTLSGIDWISV